MILSPREREAAYGCGQRWTVKKISGEMKISVQRVHALINSVAGKLGICDGCDARVCVGDWWLAKMTDCEAHSTVLKSSTA